MKKLRGGKWIKGYRPYKIKEETPIQIWYSEKLDRTYSSEKRMRAAEAASERMKKYGIINKIENKLPINWSDLKPAKNSRSWNNSEDSVFYRIFYNHQNHYWEELKTGSVKWYYQTYGMDNGDENGHTLRDFIKDILPNDILTEEEKEKINEFWGMM